MSALSLSLRAVARRAGGLTVRSVDVSDERPDVARLLRGRRVAEALELVGRLYGVCGQAQRVAAAVAVAVARDGGGEPTVESRLRMQREALQEHAMRILLDWPRAFGLPVDVARLRELARRLAVEAATPAAAAEAIGGVLDDLLPGSGWLAGGARTPPAVAQLFECVADGECAAHGGDARPVAEEGAYARFAEDPWVAGWQSGGRPVCARLAARFVALREIVACWRRGAAAEAGDVRAEALEAHAARCVVDTARGRLAHQVVLDGERVADWRITVPTDVNFAPGGAWVRRVAGASAADVAALRSHGACWARALDPCVEWRLEVCDA
ncbi:MAG: hypothetical protein MUF07_00280 [Steroidobacteraceae bacterium]|jgi:hypothetical protein|nr:hypothetical protein [Steroidobacteraceae bacterium]